MIGSVTACSFKVPIAARPATTASSASGCPVIPKRIFTNTPSDPCSNARRSNVPTVPSRPLTCNVPTLSALIYDVCHDVCASRILLQEHSKSLRPALETFWTSEGNNDRQYLRRCRRHHRSFRIAGGAAMRSSGITKHGQSFQIQIVFANALIGFCCASRAKNNFAGHMRQVVQPNRQAAFHRREIDRVHHGVDLRQTFSRHHAPQQRFRRTAVSRRIFSQCLVRDARRFHLRRRQYAAREGQFLNFRLSPLHLIEQRGRRYPRFHARRHATQRRSRALRFQFWINRYIHRGLSSQPVSDEPRSAARTLPGGLFRSRGSVRVCAKRPESLPRRTRCGSAYTRAAESPAAPDPFSRARRTSAFQSPPSESRLPGKARWPAPRPETGPAERAAGRRADH